MSRFRRIVDNAIRDQRNILVPGPLESIKFRENCKKFIESATKEQLDDLFGIKRLKEKLPSPSRPIERDILEELKEAHRIALRKMLRRDEYISQILEAVNNKYFSKNPSIDSNF